MQAALTAALVVAATAIAPSIDLAVARFAMLPLDSSTRDTINVIREAFRVAPYVLFLTILLALGVCATRGRMAAASAARQALFLATALAIGPGLMVNAGLKTYSHRPRPLQTTEISGGASAFRPFYRFDGACQRNCSFSSGEAASAFWTTAPALLAPPPVRVAATAAALAYGLIVSALRMVLGAHFLSDVAFSAFLVLAVTLLTRRIVLRC